MVERVLRRVRGWILRHWANVLFVLAALGIVGVIAWDGAYVRMVTWDDRTDYWEHSATLHALIENPWHPRHPHLNIDAGAPRFGPQFILVALLAQAFSFDAIQAMSLAAVLNVLLFVCAIRAFFITYFRHPLAPLYALLVMFGGAWHAFRYSNVYSLPILMDVASFPSTTALGLTLLGFTHVLRVLQGKVRRKWLALLVLGVWAAAVFIIHPLTAMLSLSGALLLILVDSRATWRLRFELAGAIVVGCALSHFWPYFSPWVVLRGGHGHLSNWAEQSVEQAQELHVKRRLHVFYQRKALLETLGLGVLTVPFLPYFFLRRSRWFIALGTLGMLVPFVANAFVEIPLGHRFVLLALVYLHIGLVALLLRLTPGHLGTLRILRFRILRIPILGIISVVGIATLLSSFAWHNVRMVRNQFSHPRFARHESPVIGRMRAIADITGPDAVVLANPALSWTLPTFGPKVLVLLHDDPLVPDLVERDDAVKRFLSPGTTDQDRWAILKQYGVSHVLAQRDARPIMHFMSKIATDDVAANGYHVFTLTRRFSKKRR